MSSGSMLGAESMSASPMIKICGIRDMKAAEAAAQGADFLGFIMNSRFWRFLEPDRVREICQGFPQVKKVGVFVAQPPEEVAQAASYCGLDFVQLHGHESPEYGKELAGLLQGGGVGIIKAFRYGEDFSIAAAESYPAPLVLIDSYSKNAEGGNGISFAWHKAAEEICSLQKPYFIAGGIKTENVREAMALFKPYAIDASSSLEIDRQKQPHLIKEFLQEAGKL